MRTRKNRLHLLRLICDTLDLETRKNQYKNPVFQSVKNFREVCIVGDLQRFPLTYRQ